MESRFRNMEGREREMHRDNEERYHHEMKKKAYEGKDGYSERRYEDKMKDQMNGMPMPDHMRKER